MSYPTSVGTIERMIRPIQKWWFLGKVRTECRKHAQKESVEFLISGGHGEVSRPAIIKQLSKVLFFSTIKDKIDLYGSLADICIRENLIVARVPDEKERAENQLSGGAFIRTTDLGDSYIEMFWWNVLVDNAISRTIICGIIIAAFTAGIGIYLKNTFEKSKSATPQSVNIYPNIYVNQNP